MYVSEFHCGLVHKHKSIKEAMKIPEAKAAVDVEWNKLENWPAWNFKKIKLKAEVDRQATDDGMSGHFASLMDVCHLKRVETCDTSSEVQGKSCAPGRQRQGRQTDTGQFSPNKAHQLHRWQRQHFWIQFPHFVWYDQHRRKTAFTQSKTHGGSFEEQVFRVLLWQDCCCKEDWASFIDTHLSKALNLGMSVRPS